MREERGGGRGADAKDAFGIRRQTGKKPSLMLARRADCSYHNAAAEIRMSHVRLVGGSSSRFFSIHPRRPTTEEAADANHCHHGNLR